jgi:enoyl-CoA hydratase
MTVMVEQKEDYSRFQHLDVQIEHGLAVVRFSPAATENFENSFFTDIRDMFVPLSRDPDVRAVLVAVEPPRESTTRFSRIITTATLEQRAGRFLTIQQFAGQLLTFRKPIVAAVAGPVSGINAVLALLCDAVIASDSALFGDGHVGIGIAAGDGGTMLWPLLVGPGMAKQILLEGRQLGASEAYGLGVVSQVVPESSLLEVASAFARKQGSLPRVAYMATKLAVNNLFRLAGLVSSDLAVAYEAATVVEPEFATRVSPH